MCRHLNWSLLYTYLPTTHVSVCLDAIYVYACMYKHAWRGIPKCAAGLVGSFVPLNVGSHASVCYGTCTSLLIIPQPSLMWTIPPPTTTRLPESTLLTTLTRSSEIDNVSKGSWSVDQVRLWLTEVRVGGKEESYSGVRGVTLLVLAIVPLHLMIDRVTVNI